MLPIFLSNKALNQESEQHTGCAGRTDDTGYVGAHGVHEQVVGGVGLLTLVVRDTGCHRHGRHTGITDERVDLLALGEEEVHELHEQYATGSSDNEGSDTYEQNLQGRGSEELACLGRGTYGETEQDGDAVDERTLGSLGKTASDTTYVQQVTEEEHTQEGQTARYDEGGEQQTNDGEDDLLCL